jgi:alpha-galactosidase/6-phospho-beta-glucosidase family protein
MVTINKPPVLSILSRNDPFQWQLPVAALLDRHTAAELAPDQSVAIVDALIEAHGDWLPAYR